MKIILSRKGFDSSAGGKPSPIFPDGQMLSLPIPDKSSPITYGEIAGNDWATVGELALHLAHIPQTHRAHLDPDLAISSFPRAREWKPIFGQASSAESHLRNHGVGKGDVFVFFGLFRSVERVASKWQYVPGSKPIHAIFGWLQIATKIVVSAWPSSDKWAHYHPHFVRNADPSNVLYVAANRLKLPSDKSVTVAGAGTFRSIRPLLCLTEPVASRPGLWLLPDWFHPENRGSVLSYHGDLSRWQRCPRGVMLSSASRGQEFVLDSEDYPEAIEWLRKLLGCATE